MSNNESTIFLGLSFEEWKNLTEACAWFSAAAFFSFKLISGYLRTDLSLSVEARRSRKTEDDDYLVIELHLRKGSNGSIALYEASARIKHANNEETLQFGSINRSRLTEVTPINRSVGVDWKLNSLESPQLNLVPSEETKLSLLHILPSSEAATVEVAVLGRRLRWLPFFGQWKASCISLPLTD